MQAGSSHNVSLKLSASGITFIITEREEAVLQQMAAALSSGTAVCLHGPPNYGKLHLIRVSQHLVNLPQTMLPVLLK